MGRSTIMACIHNTSQVWVCLSAVQAHKQVLRCPKHCHTFCKIRIVSN